jgi:hypothetical protein
MELTKVGSTISLAHKKIDRQGRDRQWRVLKSISLVNITVIVPIIYSNKLDLKLQTSA